MEPAGGQGRPDRDDHQRRVDRGDPGLLSREMARFSRSVHRTIWLNPLAGREGYSPETRGLKAALPYVDDFCPPPGWWISPGGPSPRVDTGESTSGIEKRSVGS